MSEINQGVWAHGVIAGGDRKGEEKKTTQPKHSHLERISLGPLVCAPTAVGAAELFVSVFTSCFISSGIKSPISPSTLCCHRSPFFFEVLPSHGCVCVSASGASRNWVITLPR